MVLSCPALFIGGTEQQNIFVQRLIWY